MSLWDKVGMIMSAGFLLVRENWKNSEFEWSGKDLEVFFGKVRESEKLVPPDVRVSDLNASNSISAPDPWGSLQHSP